MADEVNDLDDLDKPEGKKKSGMLIIIIIVLNILIVGGGAAYFFLVMNNDSGNSQEDENADNEDQAQEKEDPSAIGPIVELSPFLVNLDEPGSNRYLKAVIQLEMNGADGESEIKGREVPLRDLVITYLSSLNYSQTQGVVNKDIIRTSLIKQINKTLSEGKVRKLYFTEFVIQ